VRSKVCAPALPHPRPRCISIYSLLHIIIKNMGTSTERNAQKREQRKNAKSNGLCLTCFKKKATNRNRCEECFSKYKKWVESTRDRRKDAKERGICYHCMKAKTATSALCSECHEKNINRSALGRSKLEEKSLCDSCRKKPRVLGKKRCQECLDKDALRATNERKRLYEQGLCDWCKTAPVAWTSNKQYHKCSECLELMIKRRKRQPKHSMDD
jgi:hypothetical protein